MLYNLALLFCAAVYTNTRKVQTKLHVFPRKEISLRVNRCQARTVNLTYRRSLGLCLSGTLIGLASSHFNVSDFSASGLNLKPIYIYILYIYMYRELDILLCAVEQGQYSHLRYEAALLLDSIRIALYTAERSRILN